LKTFCPTGLPLVPRRPSTTKRNPKPVPRVKIGVPPGSFPIGVGTRPSAFAIPKYVTWAPNGRGTVGVRVRDGVRVGVGVTVGVGVRVRVCVGVAVGVRVFVTVGVMVGVAEGVLVEVRVGVRVAVLV